MMCYYLNVYFQGQRVKHLALYERSREVGNLDQFTPFKTGRRKTISLNIPEKELKLGTIYRGLRVYLLLEMGHVIHWMYLDISNRHNTQETSSLLIFWISIVPVFGLLSSHQIRCLPNAELNKVFFILTLILRRSRTGTVWFYTSTSNKRAARPKLYTKSLTRDLKLMYSRFTLVRISINL